MQNISPTSLPFPWLPQKMLICFCSFFHSFICERNFTFGSYICLLDSFLWYGAQEMSLPCIFGFLCVWKKQSIFLIFSIAELHLYTGFSLIDTYIFIYDFNEYWSQLLNFSYCCCEGFAIPLICFLLNTLERLMAIIVFYLFKFWIVPLKIQFFLHSALAFLFQNIVMLPMSYESCYWQYIFRTVLIAWWCQHTLYCYIK